MASINKKVVTVGDAFCGKTSLLMVSSLNKGLDGCQPNQMENVDIDIDVDGNEVALSIYNTAGELEGLLGVIVVI